MLNFDPVYRFSASPGPIAAAVVEEFYGLIKKVATQNSNRKFIFEHYKKYFGDACGRTVYSSSSESWAEGDLLDYMVEAAENALTFIEAFYDGGAALSRANSGLFVPDAAIINHVLSKNSAGYEIRPPDLLMHNPQTPIPVSHRAASLDDQAQEVIHQSLKKSEAFLSSRDYRQAVQEILWLLETVSTLFKGLSIGESTIEGKYFNKIASDLRTHQRGTTLEHALDWATKLHGYLSSPGGGGVRHGADLRSGLVMSEPEAELFCNLIRSYINFLIAEYERLKPAG
jgi:hypothetical protein